VGILEISSSLKRGKVDFRKETRSSSVVIFCGTKRGPSSALF
jgi:hypothetical protein